MPATLAMPTSAPLPRCTMPSMKGWKVAARPMLFTAYVRAVADILPVIIYQRDTVVPNIVSNVAEPVGFTITLKMLPSFDHGRV